LAWVLQANYVYYCANETVNGVEYVVLHRPC